MQEQVREVNPATSPIATPRDPLTWGGESYPMYEVRLEVAAPAATATPAESGAPAGGTSSPGTPGSAAASPAAVTDTQTVDWKTAPEKLRSAYETTARELEPWKKIGASPEQVAANHQVAASLLTELNKIGGQLGYEATDVEEAFRLNPIRTIQVLQEKLASASVARPKPGEAPDLKKAIEEEVGPIKAHLNRQMVEAARGKYDTEFETLLKAELPDFGGPDLPKARKFLYDFVGESMKYDVEAMKRLKNEGKTSDIKKHFDFAKNALMAVITEFQTFEAKKAGASTGVAGKGTGSVPVKASLEDFITGTPAADQAYAAARKR